MLTDFITDPEKRKKMYEQSNIETGLVATQVHTLLFQTAADLCRVAEQMEKKRHEYANANIDEARYGAATILLVLAALEGAIHTAAALVGEKYNRILVNLIFEGVNHKKRNVPPRKLAGEVGISLKMKWKVVPPHLTNPDIIGTPSDKSAPVKIEFTEELERLVTFINTRNSLLQHHHPFVEHLPLELIQTASGSRHAESMMALNQTERYNAKQARKICILAADLMSPLHKRLQLRGFWSDLLENELRTTLDNYVTKNTSEQPQALLAPGTTDLGGFTGTSISKPV